MLNFFLLIFVLLMAYWWSLQGLFSAFLHLILVICCGALAFAFWQPTAYWMLSFDASMLASNAWGGSLFVLFVAPLIILRPLMDKLISRNMYFPDMANKLGGACCGAAAGWLTVGIVLIAISFLPIRASFVSWQPYVIDGAGRVAENRDTEGGRAGALWLPAPNSTATFFNRLSGGAFSSSAPMDVHTPDLANEAVIFRLISDENISKVVAPDKVKVLGAYKTPTDKQLPAAVIELLKDIYPIESLAHQIIIVDTQWLSSPSSYDRGTLFLDPRQVALLSTPENDRDRTVIDRPIALTSQKARQDERRTFIPVNAASSLLYTTREDPIACVFLVPVGHQPRFIRLRNISIPIEIADATPQQMDELIGAPAETPQAAPQTPRVRPQQGGAAPQRAVAIEETDQLPRPISSNLASGLTVEDRDAVARGTQWVNPVTGALSQKNAIRRISHASHIALVRLELTREQANSYWGSVRAAASALQPIFLVDSFNENVYPFAYVLLKTDKKQLIHVDPDLEIHSGQKLPMQDMTAGDKLFVYFRVDRERGMTIKEYRIGTTHVQAIEPSLPITERQ